MLLLALFVGVIPTDNVTWNSWTILAQTVGVILVFLDLPAIGSMPQVRGIDTLLQSGCFQSTVKAKVVPW